MNEELKTKLIEELKLMAWQSTAYRGKNQRERDRNEGRRSMAEGIIYRLEHGTMLKTGEL